MAEPKQCGNCAHFYREFDYDYGDCRFNAPVMSTQATGYLMWPRMQDRKVCSRHEWAANSVDHGDSKDVGHAAGYADAIADVIAFLRSIGRTEECTYEQARIAADFSERIKDGDAKGARHG